MVVLEGGGMLSTSGNQYLQPDYLSPLPTTLDAKKSPLALLAQTCSQIGADSPTSKPLIAPLDKPPKKSHENNNNRSPPAKAAEKRSTPESKFGVFKPYESTVLIKKEDSPRPPSSKPSEPSKSASPATTPAPETGKTSPLAQEPKPGTPRGASPIIRSGLEMLQAQHPKDAYKHMGALCCPPGLEHTNPAFRPPFPGAPFSHHHAMMGYAGGAPPYLSYARVKTPSGGEALVPVCKDPYCASCQFGMHGQQLMMGGACPGGCTQCDHQKYNLAMAMSLGPPSSLAAYSQLGRPFVCNWISGEAYCGKRFVTSEELLQHLRTHTSGAEVPVTTAASQMLFSAGAGLHRYPNAPLSPLSAARYHPYGKPPALPSSLAASPYSAFNPTALGAYYAPYSLYGQRIGAAVHP